MWRRATDTPIDSATLNSLTKRSTTEDTRDAEDQARLDSYTMPSVSSVWRASHTEFLRIPSQPELARRRHVADERRRGDDGGTGKIAFTAETHAILPVAVERSNCALPLDELVGTLAEARTAPRLSHLAANRLKHFGNRLAAETRIRAPDLESHAARSGKDHELLRRARGAVVP